MLPQRLPDYTALQRLLQQTDADWERLTQVLQADQQRLEALRQRRAHLHLLLTLDGESPAKACPAIAAQCAALERQMAVLEQKVLLERARRDALEQQFEQERLVLVILRRMSQRRRSRWATRRKLLLRPLTWLLREFWTGLQTFEPGAQIIPPDRSLGPSLFSPPKP